MTERAQLRTNRRPHPGQPGERLRVIHAIQEYLNNTENWIYRLLQHLPDTTVVIASRHFLTGSFYTNDFEYLEFPVKEIKRPHPKLPERGFNKLVRTALKLYPWYVARIIESADLLHSHFADVAWDYQQLARKLRVPHVVSFYGYDYQYLPHTQPRWVDRYRILFQSADLFLCEGENGARLLEEMGCPADKIKVARLGVQTAAIPFVRRRKTSGELRLLQVASLRDKKGHRYTVEAFLHAIRDCPNMSLTLVGQGSTGNLSRLQEMIRGTGAQDRVQFLSGIDFNHLHEFMKGFHVFIHPSCHSETRDCEGGAPIVLLDAQATGMPVIATTHCDIPSEVIHGVTGFLAPERNSSQLADYIRRFYAMNGTEYDQFADAARTHVETNYDAVICGAHVKAIYDELLDGHTHVPFKLGAVT